MNEAGEMLLPMARKLLDLSQNIEETMWSLEEQVAGHIVIGCTTTAGKYALPFLAAAFSQSYPNVRVTIDMCDCDSIDQSLLSREVHLGISNTKIIHRELECRFFFADRVILVVPADHPFATRSSVQPAELLHQPFILREEGCNTCQLVREGMADQGIAIDQLKVAMVVGNAEAIEVAVEHGLGVAFISHLAARHGLKSGCIVEVPVEGLRLERPLYVVRNRCCAKTTAEARLWDFIEQYRGEIAYTLDIRDPQEGFERSATVASS